MLAKQHFFGKVRQKAIITKGNQVLITREKGEKTWELPGGRLEFGEIPEEGLKREIQEELGVAIDLKSIIYTGQYIKKVRENRIFF